MQGGLGKVYLVGAGPGDPELITVKGKRLIESCDALVYDDLVEAGMRDWVKPGCRLEYVGKRPGRHSREQSAIESLLVELAGEGLEVVRLKGGDPFVLGRGGEEAMALHRRGIPFEVVPAVTAALGCAAYCGIPLTHREWSSAVTLLSGHEDPGKANSLIDWGAHARSGATLVLYMAMGRLEDIARALMDGGREASTPACAIEWGTTPRQRSVSGALESIAWKAREAGLGAPAVVIIGPVAVLGDLLAWFDPSI